MPTWMWLLMGGCCVLAFLFGYVAGVIRASNKFSALLNQAAKEIAANSQANRELFAALKEKGIY